jgi:ribosome-associated heat shock protein Hsp15
MAQNRDEKCRLDKWLWGARFYKTRSIAADAVSGGKVRVNGGRAKSAKEVQLGMAIQITNKDAEMMIEVSGLSNTRRGAPEAARLFKETKESKTKRENLKATNAAEHALRERGAGRPTKRQLRDIAKFTGINGYDGL